MCTEYPWVDTPETRNSDYLWETLEDSGGGDCSLHTILYLTVFCNHMVYNIYSKS